VESLLFMDADITYSDLINLFSPFNDQDTEEIENEWDQSLAKIQSKIIVLDDDPTGAQAVDSVPIYMTWEVDTFRQIYHSNDQISFILTNSRSLNRKETAKVLTDVCRNLQLVFHNRKKDFILIMRSDSTLRGHYPLESEIIYRELRKWKNLDGEILIPFFLEGGRLTANDIHYVKVGDILTPAGLTEFSQDKAFGFSSSNLREWIEEKSNHSISQNQISSVSLETIRKKEFDIITDQLLKLENFEKLIVNCLDYTDLKIFVIALIRAIHQGKCFVFRTAASFIKAMKKEKPKPMLTFHDLFPSDKKSIAGLIIIGSHAQRTNDQFYTLQELHNLKLFEWDIFKAGSDYLHDFETKKIGKEAEDALKLGFDVCIYTTRSIEKDYESNKGKRNFPTPQCISEGLVDIVKKIRLIPRFIVIKGGSTASDIVTKGIGAKKAIAIGQILPGIPVWNLESEARYKDIPLVIFPGNVGDKMSLKKVVQILRNC